MARFLLKQNAGRHVEGGKTYSGGQFIVSDRDLIKLFPEKFERVHESPGTIAAPKPGPAKPPEAPPAVNRADRDGDGNNEDDAPEGDGVDDAGTPGDDCTDKFPGAQDKGLRVYKLPKPAKDYAVTDADNTTVTIHTGTAAAVKKYVKDAPELDDEEK